MSRCAQRDIFFSAKKEPRDRAELEDTKDVCANVPARDCSCLTTGLVPRPSTTLRVKALPLRHSGGIPCLAKVLTAAGHLTSTNNRNEEFISVSDRINVYNVVQNERG